MIQYRVIKYINNKNVVITNKIPFRPELSQLCKIVLFLLRYHTAGVTSIYRAGEPKIRGFTGGWQCSLAIVVTLNCYGRCCGRFALKWA